MADDREGGAGEAEGAEKAEPDESAGTRQDQAEGPEEGGQGDSEGGGPAGT
jgi:hypothetical protein